MGVDPGPDAPLDADRLARNLRAVARRLPALAAGLPHPASVRSTPVVADGRLVDVDLGGTPLYGEPAPARVARQLARFSDDPLVLYDADLDDCNLSPASLRLLDDLRGWLRAAGPQHLDARPATDVGYLFVFGVGLGLHLAPLLERTTARRVVLVESRPELLWHALVALDWEQLFEIADRRRLRLHAVVAADPEAICAGLEDIVSACGSVFLDGSCAFLHDEAWPHPAAVALLRERLWVHAVGDGSVEDEREMLRTCSANLRHRPLRVLEPGAAAECSHPVILVGAGPSLDDDLPRLQALRDRAIVVSCGTAIGILLKHGIRPDLHCEIERGAPTFDLLAAEDRRHGLHDITLIAATTVDPRLPALFERTWFYVRGGIGPARTLTRGFEPLPFVDPNCATAAFAAVAALGFRRVWLLGLDLGQRRSGRHHARDSVYYAPGHEADDADYRGRFSRTVAGNFGGEVQTSWDFDAGRQMLARAQRHYRLELVNCSDGAEIAGARPQRAAAVDLPEPAVPRRRLLDRIDDRLGRADAGGRLAAFDAAAERSGAESLTATVDAVLASWLAADSGFWDLEEALVETVLAGIGRYRLAQAMTRGSMLTMLRLGSLFHARLPDSERRRAYRAAFAELFGRHCRETIAAAAEAIALLPARDAATVGTGVAQ